MQAITATEQIASQLAEFAKSGKVEVPVLPETAHRVMMLTQDADSDAEQLANIIQSDPTMCGHVMRVANSAAYTPNSNLVSIQQAVTRLGMIEISNIALSTSLNSKIFNAPGYEQYIAVIWQHALATALWSKEVARSMRSNVEASFLCGLLHSIGKPVILQTIADNMQAASSAIDDEQLQQLFDEFESEYGHIVAGEWELPKIVTEAIGFHKRYEQAPSQPEIAATIAFGRELANLMLHPNNGDKDAVMNSPTLNIINLYPDEVQAIIEKEEVIKNNMDTLSI